MVLSEVERWVIVEALKSAQSELEEMGQTEEWFVSDSLDQIESALEILDES